VSHIDCIKNLIVVGAEEDLYSRGLIAGEMNYIAGSPPEDPLNVEVKIRYRAKPVPAILYPEGKGEKAKIIFSEQQKAVTPGQSAVLYSDDEVIGGGIIDTPLTGQV
jgi:tRNA-specific 2-thiouridylase